MLAFGLGLAHMGEMLVSSMSNFTVINIKIASEGFKAALDTKYKKL